MPVMHVFELVLVLVIVAQMANATANAVMLVAIKVVILFPFVTENLFAVVFLIFDVELVLIFPIVVSQRLFFCKEAGVVLVFFILILLLGLGYELNQGRLRWAQ